MDTSYLGLFILVLFVLLVMSLIGGKKYRCSKCGFTTSSYLESVGHATEENKHKCEEQ